MLSTSNLKSAQAATYFEKDDYYSHEEGPNESRWFGVGAEQLQLTGGVKQETFQQVLNGKAPDGQPLFSRKIDPAKRRAATDFTFSAPKSVSVAALVQGDRRVVEAHRRAVDRTLQVLEDRYSETRVTTDIGRRTVKTGNLIAAIFPHGTSREAEPQLHSHCVVMNATQLKNGGWYSFLNDSAIMNKKLLGQIYQNELAVELKKIGYEVEQREHGQFDIKSYSPELLETFSTRRGQIESLMAKWRASGKVVRDADGKAIRSELLLREVANLKTRKAKPQIVEAGQLLQSWQSVLAMRGMRLPELPGEQAAVENAETEAGAGVVVEERAIAPLSVIEDAIAHCGERDAIFKTTAIEKFAFEHHIGNVSVADLGSAIATHPELLKVDEKKGKVTTQSALQLELSTIRLMQQGQGKVRAIASDETIAAKCEGSSLSEEQRSAIATSCQSLDQVIGWQGAAGAGKTYALNALREIAEAQGYEVSGYAPSSAAAHELGASLSIETNTVARLLLEPSAADPDSGEQRKLWLIDEAGLLSMRDARALLTKANENKARVVLVGDTRQLSAVEAGNPFRSLQASGMVTAHLDQARRQEQAKLRQAVQMISQGEVGAGIQVLNRSGCISEIKNEETRATQLVDDFLALSPNERAQTLLLSGTNANRLALTAQIRVGLQAEGALGEDVYEMRSLQRKDLTQVQGRYAGHYAVGDVVVPIRDYRRQGLERNQQYRVSAVDTTSNRLVLEAPDNQLIQIDPSQCERKAVYTTLNVAIAVGDRLKWTKNNRVAGTRNGQQFTLESITPEGIAQIANDQGERRTADLSSGAQHIDYAWVSTTYSSQGKTAGAVMALMDKTTNKEAFYVATSRAKQRVQFYTSSVEDLQELAERSRANENVSDYLPLFDLTQLEITQQERPNDELIADEQAAADNAGEASRVADGGSRRGQPTVDDADRPSAEADIRARSITSQYVEDVRRVGAGIEERRRTEELCGQVERFGEAAQWIDGGAEQLALTAAAADRLNGQLERQTERAGASAAELVDSVGSENLELEDAQLDELSDLQPPTSDASLAQLSYSLPEITGGGLILTQQTVARQTTDSDVEEADYNINGDLGPLLIRDDNQIPAEANTEAEVIAPQYVGDVRRIVAGIEERRRTEELAEQIEQFKGAVAALNSCGETIAPTTIAAVRLAHQLERQAQRSVELTKKLIEPISLKQAELPVEPLVLQPPEQDTPLEKQLDAFADTLGYQPGDRLYVRALLPKHLSDELALKHRLKFETGKEGKTRLIPNTRRGYLTVGSWAFTHIRKDKAPAVHPDGLAKLTELNKEGRGVYFVVNPGGEKDGDITSARSLFWENDDKTKAEQIEQATTSGIPLGAVIETNKSVHCYAPLSTPITDLDAWKQLQERLIQKMAADPAIRNSSRLMRLPGFDHVRVEGEGHAEKLVFTPVTLRHIDQTAQVSVSEVTNKLPQWDETLWAKASKQKRGKRSQRDTATAPTMAVDNPWDIRNFSQYLNGDQYSQNGWLQVQCPHHGSEGSSGTSLGINEETGQYTCHGGCDSKDVYKAAWELSESRGWQPPKKARAVTVDPETAPSSGNITAVPALPKQPSRWERYSASIDAPPGPQRDLRIAKRAITDGLSKKQAISLLAKNSPKAQKLYHDEGSTPAYNYVSMVVKAAQQQSAQSQMHLKGRSAER